MSSNKSKALLNIEELLDEKSFVEIGALVKARNTDFSMNSKKVEGDGVVTGYGLINDNKVFIYSLDKEVLGGSIGEMNAKKISNLYEMAVSISAPIIGLIDSSGIRLEESSDALNAVGLILKSQAKASGVIPQIGVCLGNCGGAMAVSANMNDFLYMENSAKLYVNSPNIMPGNSEDKVDTSSATYNYEKNSKINKIGTKEEIFADIRELLTYIPLNPYELSFKDSFDELNRASDIEDLVSSPIDMLKALSDSGEVYETKPGFANNIITAFIRLDGVTVGVIANNSADCEIAGGGIYKAGCFIKYLNAFNIPLLTITNVTSFKPCIKGERRIASLCASMVSNLVMADIPKVNLIVGKAYATPYIIMNSKALGCDLTYAWPSSSIGMMDASLAAKIISRDGADSDSIRDNYEEIQSSILSAASRGYVDTIIEPIDTRKYLIGAFGMLLSKGTVPLERKHDTI